MQDYATYVSPFAAQTANVNYGYIAASAIFYAFVLFATFYSVAAMFILVRHAQSKLTGLGASVVFGIIYLALIAQGLSLVNALK